MPPTFFGSFLIFFTLQSKGLISWAGWLGFSEISALLFVPLFFLGLPQQKSTSRLHDNRASPVSWDPSIGIDKELSSG